MKLSIKVGSTSQTINVFVQDSSSTTGAGLTGLVFNTSSLVAYYALPRAAAVQITLATLAAVTTAYSSGGFKEIDATNMPGWYRLDLPDAAIASGRFVSLHIKGATNMAPLPLEIELTAWDNQDAVRGGMTALPNANAAASGGVPVLGTNATAISFTGGMTISNAGGDALTLLSSGSNGSALAASGNGSGAGIKATGGATGNGVQAVGGATSGSAIKASGTNGNAIALELAGQGSAAALSCTGGATGAGAKFVGGGTSGDGIDITTTSGDGLSVTPTAGHGIVATGNGTTKHGISATGGATTSHGISATGGGVGHGILATSGAGATGDGIKAVAASTNGNGLNLVAVGTGAGALATGGGTGHGAKLVGGATSGDGLNAAAATSGSGINAAGAGTTKPGMLLTGGTTTSAGLSLVGGGTSGDGLLVATTSGHGFNVAATGTGKHGATFTGGNGGTSDGVVMAAGTGGVDLRANQTGNITGNLSGSAGSVTGNVGGNVTGSVASVVGAVGSVTGLTASDVGAIKTKADQLVFTVANQLDVNVLDWKSATAPAMTGDAFARLGAPAGASVSADVAAVGAYVDTEVGAIKTVTDKLGTTLEDAGGSPGLYRFTTDALGHGVWDESIAIHLNSGSTGSALNAAGAAGDPWSTSLPGVYGSGTAGKIIGDNINATISSRASQASVDAVDDFVDTEVAAIKAVTDRLNSTMESTGSPSDYVFTAAALAQGPSGITAAAIRAAVGLASANLDTQLDALPTNAELSTALGLSDDAVIAILGAPAGASMAADIAAVKVDTAAIKTKTDSLTFTVSGHVDANTLKVSGTTQTAGDIIGDTNDIQTRLPAALVSGRMDSSVGAMAANVITAAAAAADFGAELADAVHDEVVDGTTTFRQSTRLHNATLGGKASGLATTSVAYRDLADSKDRVAATVDGDGNRSAVTLDLT